VRIVKYENNFGNSEITEGLEEFNLMLLLCSLILIFNCFFVWPTYEASQFLQEIL